MLTIETARVFEPLTQPSRYKGAWGGLGDYARAFEGAYFAVVLNEARQQGRIGKVSADPLLPIRLFWDIGGAGAKADACAIWVVQWVAQEIRVLDYIEGQGQVLGYYTNELRHRGYDKAICHLPHDGVNANVVTGLRFADHLKDAEFQVQTHPNMGAGAAAQRIEAVRRIFPKVWFNEETTEAGRDALGFYHAKKDENRDVDLGPEHDWSSHAADAFGLMAVAYKEPSRSANFNRKIEFVNLGIVKRGFRPTEAPVKGDNLTGASTAGERQNAQFVVALIGAIDPRAGYLSGGAGCVTTAAWWCHQQPPSPIADVMMMANARRRRRFSHYGEDRNTSRSSELSSSCRFLSALVSGFTFLARAASIRFHSSGVDQWSWSSAARVRSSRFGDHRPRFRSFMGSDRGP
jgi:hypothetical protein